MSHYAGTPGLAGRCLSGLQDCKTMLTLYVAFG